MSLVLVSASLMKKADCGRASSLRSTSRHRCGVARNYASISENTKYAKRAFDDARFLLCGSSGPLKAYMYMLLASVIVYMTYMTCRIRKLQ